MGLYTGNNNWVDNVYQFEETDLVLGGPNGIDNKPLKELADRTTWLRNALRGYNGVTTVIASQALTKTDVILKLVLLLVPSANAIIDLPVLDVDDAGLRVSIASYSAKQLTVNSASGITCFSSEDRNSIFIADGEQLELIWTGAKYLLLDFSGNFLSVGDFDYGYKQKQNTIIADGALLLRSDYPRLFAFTQTLGSSLISDYTWNSVAGYKGFFTSGTNATNFRIPDLRSMFIRGLDLGAGITYGRNNDNSGGYEVDEFKSHTHTMSNVAVGQEYSADRGSSRNSRDASSPQTGSTGGTETRPKNIGLLPLIKI